MEEQPRPQPHQATRRYSDAEANEIYKRAAEIESKTLFLDDTLTRDQVEEAANSAGISDEAVDAAIAQIEREHEEAKAEVVARSKTRQQVLIAGGLLLALLGISAALTQRGFSARLTAVENARANVDTALQRRQDLIPNIVRLAKANLKNERDLVAALSKPNVDAATVERATQRLEGRGIQSGALDEWAGTENRIAVARRRFNESASQYNRGSSSFPSSLWRPLLGFPARIEPFAADKSAQTAPTFD